VNFDLTPITKSKQAYRAQLAARPIAEKLRLLDELRARDLLLRAALPSRPAVSPPRPQASQPVKD
jgi:hypothetical protein